MTNTKQVADAIFKELFDNYLSEQVNELNGANIEELNPIYAPLFEFYHSSSEEGKANIVGYIEEIITDTASIVLAGIDHKGPLSELSGNFELTYDGEVVSGDLEENFLSNFRADDEMPWDNGVTESNDD